MAPTRFARRETLRDADLRWTMPFCAVRTMTGSASFISLGPLVTVSVKVSLSQPLRKAAAPADYRMTSDELQSEIWFALAFRSASR